MLPVHDSQAYLEECLASLTAQTEPAIEIVCVDDGSTDGSAALLKRAADRDARIRVIAQPNRGVSAARNAGIVQASAPYLCFVDADDKLEPFACERMLEVLEGEGADVVVFGASAFPEDREPAWLKLVLSPRDIEYDGFDPDIVFKEQSRPHVWKTAYRTGFLTGNRISFDEALSIGEDQAFLFEALPRAKKTVFISDKLYDYRLPREDSAMAKVGDSVELLETKIALARTVFESWERLGLRRRCACELLTWFVDLTVFEAMKLDDAAYAAIAEMAGDAVRAFWADGDLAGLGLPEPVSAMLDAVLARPIDRRSSKRRWLMIRYYVWLNGLGSIVKRLVRRR